MAGAPRTVTELLETEIKLRFDSVAGARRRIEAAGGRLVRERHFEDNRIFDNPERALSERGALLRVRATSDGSGRITYKEKVPAGEEGPGPRAKVRREWEIEARPAATAARILELAGFEVVYRYQKHRTTFRVEGCSVELDETPMGCFVEIEGPREEIGRVAERLGAREKDFITEDYRSLHLAWLEDRGLPAGHMIFPAGRSPREGGR